MCNTRRCTGSGPIGEDPTPGYHDKYSQKLGTAE